MLYVSECVEASSSRKLINCEPKSSDKEKFKICEKITKLHHAVDTISIASSPSYLCEK